MPAETANEPARLTGGESAVFCVFGPALGLVKAGYCLRFMEIK
jgi:hypothetical protein